MRLRNINDRRRESKEDIYVSRLDALVAWVCYRATHNNMQLIISLRSFVSFFPPSY